MDEKLYLDSELVDLGTGSITRKMQIADFKDISVFKSSYSYTKTLPFTSNNKRIMEFLGVVGGNSTKPYTKIRCDYYLGSTAIIRNGNAIIKESNNGYEISLIDGVLSMSDSIGISLVSDLDLTALDHNLTPQTVIDSWENTSGYIYALANFGLGYSNIIDVKLIRPSIFLHTIIDEIFSQNGLIKDGDFFTTNTEYLNELLTPTTGYLVDPESYEYTDKGTAESDTVSETDTSANPISSELDFELTDIDLVTSDLEINIDSNILINTKGFYSFVISYNKTTTPTLNYIKTYINGVVANIQEVVIVTGAITVEIGCDIGDVVSFSVLAESSESAPTYTIDYLISFSLVANLLTGSRLVHGYEFAQNIGQAELLKNTAQKYGLIIETYINDNEQVVYLFKRLDDVLSDKENAIDYTDKVVNIGKESYQVEYAQNNYAKFKYPTDSKNTGFDGNLIIDNLNLKQTGTLFAALFEIPDFTSLDQGESVYNIPLLKISDGEIEAANTPAKIVTSEIKVQDIILTLFLPDSGQQVSSGAYVNLENIDMQHKIDTNYFKFKEINDKYVEQEVVLKLSPIDIYNFRFFNLIYLKQTQSYYYCDTNTSISGGNSTLTLIKVY